MGALEDLGFNLDYLDSDSPALDQLGQGTVPQPSMLEALGFDLSYLDEAEPSPQAREYNDGSMLKALGFNLDDEGNFGLQQWDEQGQAQAPVAEKPDLTLGRIGGSVVEGGKDVARSYVDFLEGVNRSANRLKREIPYYDDGGKMKEFVDFAMKYHPILAPFTSPEIGEALYRLGKSEFLAQDPDYMNSSGYIEDVFRAGPQIGAMVLANVMGGPVSGMAAMGAMIAGQTYRNAVDAGTDPEDAMLWGLINAAVQAPMEQIGISKAMKYWKVPKNKALFNLREIVEVGATEWLTEFAQSFPDDFVNIFSTNPDLSKLEKWNKFTDGILETAKQGAYEGLVTAPWSLLTYGAGKTYNKYRRGAPKPDPNADKDKPGEVPPAPPGPGPGPAPEFTTEPYEEFSAADIEALAQMGGGMAQSPAGMSPEEYTAQLLQHIENIDYADSFDEEFTRRREGMKEFQVEQKKAYDEIMAAAEVAAQEKRLEADWQQRQEDYRGFMQQQAKAQKAREQENEQKRVMRELQQELAESRKKIQKSIDFISSEGLEAVASRAITKEHYQQLRETMGERIGWFYEADISSVPHGHRAAFSLLEREAHQGEPRAVKFDEQGNVLAKGSTYPDWFRKPFRAGGKARYKFSLADFDNLMGKLKRGETLTSRQADMFDRLLAVSEEKQKSEPELYQVQDLEEIQKEGFEVIAGRPIYWGGVGVGGRIIVQEADGTWDDYQMVGEENDEAIFANATKEFRKPAGEKTSSIVAYRMDDEWIRQQWEQGAEGAAIMPDEARYHKPMKFGAEAVAETVDKASPEALGEAQKAEAGEGSAWVKLPVKERRREAGRLPWDAPFREQWLNAQDMSQEDFIDYGEAMVETGDQEFLQFSRRMGKAIEKDTPLTEALKIVHARVQAGMPPAKKISEMSDSEVKAAAVTDFLTGLRNRQAFEQEDERKQNVVSIDLDALKWINDNLGHHVGDGMLMLFADAMRASGLSEASLYHISGDEFVMHSDSLGELTRAVDKINEYLSKNPLKVNFNGVTIPYQLGVSYGFGETIRSAEQELAAAKAKREAAGERPGRGATPGQILEGLAAGGQTQVSKNAEPGEAAPKGPGSYDLKIPRLREKPSYAEVQTAIDNVEDQLLKQNIPSTEWENVSALNDLYRKRDRAEEVELVDGLSLIPGDTEINYTYLHAQTGEKIKGRINAREALNEVDTQLDNYYGLLECLTNARN